MDESLWQIPGRVFFKQSGKGRGISSELGKIKCLKIDGEREKEKVRDFQELILRLNVLFQLAIRQFGRFVFLFCMFCFVVFP